jgi:hypothetical protein
MSGSTGRGYTRVVDEESPAADTGGVQFDPLDVRYDAARARYVIDAKKSGDIIFVERATINTDPQMNDDYKDKFAVGTSPFITRRYIDASGRVREVHWLKHERFNWWVRFGSGILFLVSAILCLIFALVGPKHFDVETRYTTDWLTNGLTPTPGNGLLNVVGSGKWVWWIMSSFWLSAFIHLFTTGLWAHLFFFVWPRSVYNGEEFPEFFLSYHNWVVAPGNYGHDPTKLSLFIVGWGVIGTVVAQAVGIANILLLVVIFFLICHFGYAFLYAQDWQHSRFAKVFAYAIPHAVLGDDMATTQSPGASIRESSAVDPQTQKPYLIAAADGLARSPAILAHTLTKGITRLRQELGLGLAIRPERRWMRDYDYRLSRAERIERAQRIIDSLPDGDPRKDIDVAVAAVPNSDQNSMTELYDDLYHAFNNPWHFVSGWWTWAFIVIVFSCYYFGALHQNSGTFAYWSHTAFWVFMFVMAVFASGYTAFWWTGIRREMTVTDVGPWHFMFDCGFQIFIGFFLLGGAHDVGLIF